MFMDLGTVRVAYDMFGSGEPLVLISGFGSCRRFWKHAIPFLDGFTVVTMDMRGVGETEYEGAFTMDDLADDVVKVMGNLGFDRFYTVGWSMGTAILQSLSARYPETVIAQALVSTYRRCPARATYVLGEFTRMVNDGTATMESFYVMVNAFCLSESVFRESESKNRLVQIPRSFERPGGLADQMSAVLAFEPDRYLKSIRTPTIIVHGTEDILVPLCNGESVKDVIRNSELFSVPGAGHNIPPAEYMAEVIGFFRRNPGFVH